MLVKITNDNKTIVDFKTGDDLATIQKLTQTQYAEPINCDIITKGLTAMEAQKQLEIVKQPSGWLLRPLPVYGITMAGDRVKLAGIEIDEFAKDL